MSFGTYCYRLTLLSFGAIVLWMLLIYSSIARAEPPVRLMTVEEERELNGMLPTLEYDSLARRAITSDELIWYTDKEMPPAYQLQNTFHSPLYNVSNQNERDLSNNLIGKDRVGNGNRDFPWVATGGTDLCDDVEIFRFVKFPKDENSKLCPLVYFTGTLPGSNLVAFNGAQTVLGEGGGDTSTQRWMYPRGTVFGELMAVQGPDDLLYPFELRFRFREKDYWEVDVYRPFVTAKELSKAIKEHREDWWTKDNLVKFVSALEKPQIVEGGIQDKNRNITAFRSSFKKHELPPIADDRLVAELLTTASWKSAQGMEWLPGVNCPTVPKGTRFHVVPEEYAAHIVAVDSQSCMNCHSHTGSNVRSFDANRGWYGRVRGQDGIFTFHPIDPSAISYDGRNKPVVFRPSLLKAGLVENYDQRRHLSNRYTLLKN